MIDERAIYETCSETTGVVDLFFDGEAHKDIIVYAHSSGFRIFVDAEQLVTALRQMGLVP